MSVTEAAYYDLHATSQAGHPLTPLWEEASRWCGTDGVVDLGCGAGGFALLRVPDYDTKAYVGVDFSEASLDIARRAVRGAAGRRDDVSWVVADLRDDPPWKESQAGNWCYVATEVLEHLADDLDVIRAWVPPGHRLIFSVPNYPSESHQRHFPSPLSVYDRYSPLLEFVAWRLYDLAPPPGRAAFLFETRMRNDAW